MKSRTDKVIVYVLRPTEDGKGHQVLQMLRREGVYMGGTWQSCSGGIEPGETAVEAAVRELREETGLFPRRLTFLSYVESFYIAETDTLWHRTGFCALVDREEALTLNEEHTASRWISRREISRAVLWPGERAGLAEIFREHVAPGRPVAHRLLDFKAPGGP